MQAARQLSRDEGLLFQLGEVTEEFPLVHGRW
jgi:hypothetical protein